VGNGFPLDGAFIPPYRPFAAPVASFGHGHGTFTGA